MMRCFYKHCVVNKYPTRRNFKKHFDQHIVGAVVVSAQKHVSCQLFVIYVCFVCFRQLWVSGPVSVIMNFTPNSVNILLHSGEYAHLKNVHNIRVIDILLSRVDSGHDAPSLITNRSSHSHTLSLGFSRMHRLYQGSHRVEHISAHLRQPRCGKKTMILYFVFFVVIRSRYPSIPRRSPMGSEITNFRAWLVMNNCRSSRRSVSLASDSNYSLTTLSTFSDEVSEYANVWRNECYGRCFRIPFTRNVLPYTKWRSASFKTSIVRFPDVLQKKNWSSFNEPSSWMEVATTSFAVECVRRFIDHRT